MDGSVGAARINGLVCYRAYSITRTHSTRTHTANCDCALDYSKFAHHPPFIEDLNVLRSASQPFFWTSIQRKNVARHRLPLRRMELVNFGVQKSVNIFQEKLGSRVVQVGKKYVHSVHVDVHITQPNKQIQNNREPSFKWYTVYMCM